MKLKMKISAALLCLLMLLTACSSKVKDSENLTQESTGEGTAADRFPEIIVSDNHIVYGSYPQTEIVSKPDDSGVHGREWETEDDYIVDESLYITLQNLSEDSWDSSGDATVGGNKYRRLKAEDATYSTSGDSNYYDWSSSDEYHYFAYEPVTWRVLELNGDDALLISEAVLDCRMYNTVIKDISWEESTIRSWLNGYDGSKNICNTDYSSGSFIDTAFTEEEQSIITESDIENNDNIKNGTEGGNNTIDRIFLLSEDEVYGSSAASYGFSTYYSADDTARRSKSSTYAKAMGAYAETGADNGNCFWWLRSPGSHPGLFTLVRCDGSVYRGGQHANSKTRGVRPCLRIAITSG